MFTSPQATGSHRTIGWGIVILLLLLRIPYSILLTYGGASSTGWGPAIYQLLTYLLTLFLIWWERDDLAAVHMDQAAIALIVIFKPVQTLLMLHWGIRTPLTFPQPGSLAIWAAAIVLAVAIWRRARMNSAGRPAWPSTNGGWLVTGVLAGCALSAIPALDAFWHVQELVPLASVSVGTGLAFFYQVGFAAAAEEPLFRGFLWGYLRRAGWSEGWVWLVQGSLFMLAHLYFINALPLQFWLIVPAAGLIFGLLAWRSRSIAPGMLAHAAYNAGAYIILLNLLAAGIRL
ncbi:MAG: lysostaphin resistance A-like protein [Anaerolineae bacterium]